MWIDNFKTTIQSGDKDFIQLHNRKLKQVSDYHLVSTVVTHDICIRDISYLRQGEVKASPMVLSFNVMY